MWPAWLIASAETQHSVSEKGTRNQQTARNSATDSEYLRTESGADARVGRWRLGRMVVVFGRSIPLVEILNRINRFAGYKYAFAHLSMSKTFWFQALLGQGKVRLPRANVDTLPRGNGGVHKYAYSRSRVGICLLLRPWEVPYGGAK